MTDKNLTNSKIDYEPATIANGATDSGAIQLRGTILSGIFVPAAFTGTSISILASFDGVNFYPVQDGVGNLIGLTVAPSQYIAIDPTTLAGANYIKLKSGSAEAAERVLTLALLEV